MDDILLNSDSDSDDESSNLEGKDTAVSTVEQAAAEAAAKLKKEQEMREQHELQMKRLQIQKQQQQQQQQRQQQQQQLLAQQKEKERQAALAEANRKAALNNRINPSPYNPSNNPIQTSAPTRNTNAPRMQTNNPSMSSNPNAKIASYGIRTPALPNQPQNTRQTHTQPLMKNTQNSQMASLSNMDFEPTPLKNLIRPAVQVKRPPPTTSRTSNPNVRPTQPHNQRAYTTNTNQPNQQHRSRPISSSTSSSVQHQVSSSQSSPFKSEKERFLMFTKVLMKYLEQKNKAMHARAKAVIRDCAEKNKQGDPNYASLTRAMQKGLYETVGKEYWQKANDYLIHFMKQNKRKKINAQQQQQQQMQQRRTNPPQQLPSNAIQPTPISSYPSSSRSMQNPSMQPNSSAQRSRAPLPHIETNQNKQYQPSVNMMTKKQPKQTIVKKAIKIKPQIPAKVNKEQIEHANKILSGMTPAQHKAHLAARNAALGSATAAASVPSTTSKKTSTIPNQSPYANHPGMMKNTNPTNLPKNVAAVSIAPKGVVHSRSNSLSPNANITAAARSKKVDSNKSKSKKNAGLDDAKAKNAGIMAASIKANSLGVGINYTLPGGANSILAKGMLDPLKEYEELMEQLDHASLFDWNAAITLVPKEILMEEQKTLLYGQKLVPDWSKMKNVVDPATVESTNKIPFGYKTPASSVSHTMNHWQKRCKGWGRENIVSPATAWASLRLLEEEENQRVETEQTLLLPPSEAPDTTTSSEVPITPPVTMLSSGSSSVSPYSWLNEEKAEEDPALALISEATQTFLKSLLEGAVSTARQRQNIDGTRLWYAQHSSSKYPLNLRLGCDVKRQVALAQGNAAKTSQRLEEALSRSTPKFYEHTKEDDEKMQYLSTSMYDLSKHPMKLENASKQAEYDAKRSFVIYGGKDSRDPPFGRAPAKKCKLMAKDFKLSMAKASFPWKMKSVTASAFM